MWGKNIKSRRNSVYKSPEVDVYLVRLMNSKDGWNTNQVKEEILRCDMRAVIKEGEVTEIRQSTFSNHSGTRDQ